MEESKEEFMEIEYNKKAFLIPIFFLVIGVILIFYAPSLQLAVVGGLLALVGVLSLMVLSFVLTQIKMIEGYVSGKETEESPVEKRDVEVD